MDTGVLHKERIDVFFTNNKHGWIGSIVLWLGIMFAYGFPQNTVALGLSLAVLIAAGLHFLLSHHYIKNQHSDTQLSTYWENRAIFISAAQGTLLGVTPWFFLQSENPSQVYLVTALLVLPLFGSAVVAGTSKKIHWIWSLTSTTPLIIFLLFSGHREYQIMAVMLTIAGIPSSLLLNVYFYDLFTKNMLLKFENNDLLKLVQQQKSVAEKESTEKSRFIAATSHDLRQPLYALNLYLDVLKQHLTQNDQKELLRKAMLSSQSLNDLLNSLMDLSRLDAGVVQAEIKKHDLQQIINTVLQDIAPLAKRRDIVLKAQVKHSILVYTDSVLLCRILRNLTLNAVRHNQHCSVDLVLSQSEHSIEIEVKDNGIGMSQEEQSHIFSEFYQIGNPERDKNKGLGLGLPIVKRLCSLLNIGLRVNSDIGKGTSFTLRLAKDDDISEWVDVSAEEQDEEPSGMFIILVDDDEAICDAIRALLRHWDCEVLVALSEQELFKELKASQYPCPDVIISDYRLTNNLNGIELIQSVRRYFKHTISAIIISGEASQKEVLEQCDWLQKPVSANTLKSMLLQRQKQQEV